MLFPKCTVWAERQPLPRVAAGGVSPGWGRGGAARAQGLAAQPHGHGKMLVLGREQSWRGSKK